MLLENCVPGCNNDGSGVYSNDLRINDNNNMTNIINENGGNTRTPIQDFYADQNIFITGGTGFLGKTVIEKLLRSCPDISTIYFMVRSKKGHNVADRVDDLFNDLIFDNLKKTSPKFRHKLVAVAGDCQSPNLGLSESDRELLIREVSIVFHSAATVRFDEKLRIATAINIGGSLAMLNLCREMKKLKAMIHVSTVYSNSHVDEIGECIYTYSMEYEKLDKMVNSLSDEAIDEMLPSLLQKWPNTYTYTKALAEQVIHKGSKDMPVGIFRPGIIISAAEEPLPGWTDNYYGPIGATVAVQLGLLRGVYYNPAVRANVVPVDYTTNALIASAWDVANRSDRRKEKMMVYNYVSTVDAPLFWTDYYNYCEAAGSMYPALKSKWHVTFTPTSSKLYWSLLVIFIHLLPAIIIDLFAKCTGNKPQMHQMLNKILKYLNLIQPFTLKDWEFTSDNVQQMWNNLDTKDKQYFKFSLKGWDWPEYFKTYMKGIKVYLLKEDLNTLPASYKRQQKLLWLYRATKALFGLFIMWMVWKMVTLFI